MILYATILALLYFITLNKKIAPLTKEQQTPIRGILTILIVLHHLSRCVNLSILQQFYNWGAPIVAMFFFFSGFGLMKSYMINGKTYLNNFLHKRICLSILMPFILALILYCIIAKINPFAIERIYAFISSGQVILPNSWFVFSILLFYIFFFISCKISINKEIWIVFGAIVAYVTLLLWSDYGQNWYISSFAFPIGMMYGKYENNILKIQNISYYAVPVLILLVIIVVKTHVKLLYLLAYPLLSVVTAILICKIPKFNNCVLLFFSSISYEIYLCHGILMYILRNECFWIESDWFFAIGTIILTLPLAYIINLIRSKISSLTIINKTI